MTSYEDIKYWIALKSVENVGNVTFNNLVRTFGSPKAVFNESEERLLKLSKITKKTSSAIASFKNWDAVDTEIERAAKAEVSVVTSLDTSYPPLLKCIYDYPPFLYVKGTLQDDISVGVVGSRTASTYGKFITERLCRELAQQGITVVSGMARGIDSSAHRGALSVNGRTIAVLGTGIDVIYPSENKNLFKQISERGAVLTEFPFSTLPNGPNFPLRNRIISGLSYGVVVTEANMKSGSLITARLALEQGRDVFAVPGAIDSPGSRGPHKLIKEGAKLVETLHDILDDLLPQFHKEKVVNEGEHHDSSFSNETATVSLQKSTKPPISATAKTVLRLIGKKPILIDDIIAKSSLQANAVLQIITELELHGYVAQLPGKRFIIEE